MASILGVGIATIDIINSVDHYPAEDEELRAQSQRIARGGNATNTLIVLSQTGHQCSWAGTLADDVYAGLISNDLDKNNVKLDHVQIVEGSSTPVSYITLNQKNGSRTIVHHRDLPELELDWLSQIDYTQYDWIHFEGRAVETLLSLLSGLDRKQSKYRISLEVEKPRQGIDALFAYVDVLMFSRAYLQATESSSAEQLLKSIHNQYPDITASCTLGNQGALLIDSTGRCFRQNALKVEVIDSIGAGDVFNAGLINSLLMTDNMDQALKQACVLAGNKCRQIGFENLVSE